MADLKISALSSAALPLAGTEVLPVVQSGATKKVAVDDLTVKNIRSKSTTGVLQVDGPAAGTTRVMTVPDANFTSARTDAGQTFTGDQVIEAASGSGKLRIKSATGYAFPGDFTWQAGGLGTNDFILVDNVAAANRWVVTSAGYHLLGYNFSNGAYRLQVNGQIFATSSTIATSDGRYKTDIKPLTNALALVAALNPVQFSWKAHQVHDFNTETPTVGFIAQEVKQVLAGQPYVNSIVKRNETELPDGTKEEFLGIAEGNIIALLTKAIQELKAEFDLYKQSHN